MSSDSSLDQHPILGKYVQQDPRIKHTIYTRTVVLWALHTTIDTELLFENVVVLGVDNREVRHNQPMPPSSTATKVVGKVPPPLPSDIPADLLPKYTRHRQCQMQPMLFRRLPRSAGPEQHHPVVRMASTCNARRGHLEKRMSTVPFRSVLSLDIEYKGGMPNFKISNRGTVQATTLDGNQ